MSRQPLPIDPVLPSIVAAVRASRACVLRAPPGAGKTTRVPQALLDAGLVPRGQRLIMLEPRRVAARAAARRIAEERGGEVGGEVGYQIRFEDRTSKATRIAILTEGLLTRKLQDDPSLEGVAGVILDELHERSIHADLALSFLREIQKDLRPELFIVAMSATMDAGPVSAFLGGAPVIDSEGRLHPVQVSFIEKPDDRPLHERISAAVKRALREDDGGDLLAFLPGAGEIQRAIGTVAPWASERFDVLPLYGELDAAAQDRAIAPRASRRRIVLATNIAETSITIDGVTTVIDSGLVKILRHDPSRGIDRLDLVRVSRASADQRAGRAGRTAPGRAFRLWTAQEDARLAPREPPEVMRIDLASAALEVIAWTGRDPADFAWFEAPPPAMLRRAVELLETLGALEPRSFRLSAIGRTLRALPLHPRVARVLMRAHETGILERGALLAALATERDVLGRAAGRDQSAHSDLILRAELVEQRSDAVDPFAARAVNELARRLVSVARRALGAPPDQAEDEEQASLRALLAGYPDRVAIRTGPERVIVAGIGGARMAKESVVKEGRLLLALEVEGGKEPLVRSASAIEEAWLEHIQEVHAARWNAEREAAEGVLQRRYLDLVLDERADRHADPAALESILLENARKDPARALPDDEGAHALFARLAFLREAMPELELPAPEPASLLPAMVRGKKSFAELRRADLAAALRDTLGHQGWTALQRHAPERVEVPSGSQIKLRYDPGAPPVLSVRLQEVFGLRQSPRVAAGRVPVTMELLSPAMRPVQVTRDLESFWRTTYQEVRKELRARYPKHQWPEDPAEGVPQRRPGRPR